MSASFQNQYFPWDSYSYSIHSFTTYFYDCPDLGQQVQHKHKFTNLRLLHVAFTCAELYMVPDCLGTLSSTLCQISVLKEAIG